MKNTHLFLAATLVFSPLLLAGGGTSVSPEEAKKAGILTKEAQAAMKPAQVLQELKDGNARYTMGQPKKRDLPAQVQATKGGQFPMAAIVSCMDSRTSSELVFDQGLGDIFSIRVAGNVANEDALGSLEYAAKVVGVKLIAVVGHSSCGAVKGACDGVELGNLTGLLKKMSPAVTSASKSGPMGSTVKATSKDSAFVEKVAKENVILAMKTIREKSPILKEMLDSGALGLVGGMYDVETGKVTFYAD